MTQTPTQVLQEIDIRGLFHLAANGALAPDFDAWELADSTGWTVGHVAAAKGHLPPDFDQWKIADSNGFSVAHAAAEHGHLPPDFDQWDIASVRGITVRDSYETSVA